MWLPLLLGDQVYNEMVKKGLKLTKDQNAHTRPFFTFSNFQIIKLITG